MARDLGILLILPFNLFWIIVSIITSIDMTVIGHSRGWKQIKYAKWLNGFIEKSRKEYKMLSDCKTHPQVIAMLLICLAMLIGYVVLTIAIWNVVNEIDTWIIWTVDALLYIPTIIWLIVSKIIKRREFDRYLRQQTKA